MRGTKFGWWWFSAIPIVLCGCCPLVVSFLSLPVQQIKKAASTRLLVSITEEQLAKDPFMKQISYAEEILLPRLTSGDASVEPLLKAQFSHSDGIRGFFVAYLTLEDDDTTIPEPLKVALKESVSDDLLELACMNVVMPTGVATMHNSADLQEDSRRTATKARRVLKYLRTVAPDRVEAQCRAILAVATPDNGIGYDDDKVQHWRRFFETYGYKERQQNDIANAMEQVLE